MSKIRSKGTKLEDKGFALLRLAGLNFRKHPKGIYGRPDAANKSKKIAVFFDSDFWHGYQYKKKLLKRLPIGYWPEKLARNIQRDKIVTRRLREEGWIVLRFWEHEIIQKPENCVERIKTAILTSSPNQMITFEYKEYVCKLCGKKFFPKKKNPSQVPTFCSQVCARKSARSKFRIVD